MTFLEHAHDEQQFSRSIGRKVPSVQEILQSMGYKRAQELGVLEPYKDAWGVNFRRPKDAWKKWETTYPNSSYYTP